MLVGRTDVEVIEKAFGTAGFGGVVVWSRGCRVGLTWVRASGEREVAIDNVNIGYT